METSSAGFRACPLGFCLSLAWVPKGPWLASFCIRDSRFPIILCVVTGKDGAGVFNFETAFWTPRPKHQHPRYCMADDSNRISFAMRRAITPTEQQGPFGNKAFRLNLGLSAAVCALILGLCVSSLFTVEASEKEHRLTVRLLDPRNGKPLTGVSLGILVWKQGRTIDLGNAVTDAHGVATFHLPDV